MYRIEHLPHTMDTYGKLDTVNGCRFELYLHTSKQCRQLHYATRRNSKHPLKEKIIIIIQEHL